MLDGVEVLPKWFVFMVGKRINVRLFCPVKQSYVNSCKYEEELDEER